MAQYRVVTGKHGVFVGGKHRILRAGDEFEAEESAVRYLLDTGRVVRIGEPKPPSAEERTSADQPPDDSVNINRLNRDALNELAASKGVEDPESLPNKGAVIAAIEEVEGA